MCNMTVFKYQHKKSPAEKQQGWNVYFVGGSSCYLCRKYLLMSDTADKRQYTICRTFIMRWTGCATLISKPPISYHIRKHLSIAKMQNKKPCWNQQGWKVYFVGWKPRYPKYLWLMSEHSRQTVIYQVFRQPYYITLRLICQPYTTWKR